MQNVSLSNAAGFDGDDFAKAKSVGVSVKLLPLIVGRIEAGNLMLDGFDLSLIKNKSGVNNWQDLFDFNGEPNKSSNGGLGDLHFKKFTIDR